MWMSLSAVAFVGEQVGEAEDGLKSDLVRAFSEIGGVHRAYLARCIYGQEAGARVVLAIVGLLNDVLIQRVESVFSKRFSKTMCLDIMNVDDAGEVALKRVCRSFFDSSRSIR